MKRRGPRVMLIVLVTVALLAALILTTLPGTTRSRIGDYFGQVFDPVVTGFQKGLSTFGAYFSAVSDNKKLKERISRLEDEMADLNLEILQNQNKLEAYDELKEALHLTTAFEDKRIHGAAILNRELGPAFDLIRVKAGRLQGITTSGNETLPVVDQHMALIGRIHSTELSSSKILPLLHEAFAVSAHVEGTYRSSFRVRGDLALQSEGLCLADHIAEGIPVKVGDRLVTSGESGIYPEGILIGIVVEIVTDGSGLTMSCKVQPAADFEQMAYVFILTEPDHES
ncbi:MAG: rod shape-determining protein MreC [Clostridiaceae bacterium]|nr:rod shape-determining protein MreC [Clostridiaceae bacterium]